VTYRCSDDDLCANCGASAYSDWSCPQCSWKEKAPRCEKCGDPLEDGCGHEQLMRGPKPDEPDELAGASAELEEARAEIGRLRADVTRYDVAQMRGWDLVRDVTSILFDVSHHVAKYEMDPSDVLLPKVRELRAIVAAADALRAVVGEIFARPYTQPDELRRSCWTAIDAYDRARRGEP
jgi:hypothetical protein